MINNALLRLLDKNIFENNKIKISDVDIEAIDTYDDENKKYYKLAFFEKVPGKKLSKGLHKYIMDKKIPNNISNCNPNNVHRYAHLC